MEKSEIYIYYFISYFPFLLLIAIFIYLKDLYFDLKKRETSLGDEKFMFEIVMPKEISKTPLAMELVFTAIHSTSGESNWYKLGFLGKRRTFYSFEIVSKGGDVKFYIWASKKFKSVIENAFYSQYPSVQLAEVLDYTKFFQYIPEKQGLFGFEYKLKKADPYPIKTYKDFGLDMEGKKPEEITDPISSIIETLGNIGPGENAWVQFVIRAQKKEYGEKKYGLFEGLKKGKFKEAYDWKTEAEEIIKKLKVVDQKEDQKIIESNAEKEVIDAISKNISKLSFWTGIRSVYFSDDERSFNPNFIGSLATLFNTLNSEVLNSLGPGFDTDFDFPWHDFKSGKRLNKIKKDFFADYKRRKYFTDSKKVNDIFLPTFEAKSKYNDFVMSVEELATIFHLPSTSITTPTFQREESKKSDAPLNLPF